MAYDDLWETPSFGTAFERWWKEDWSWDGLATKYQRSSLGDFDSRLSPTLQEAWRGEADRLIEFAGRRWTRFHLPPFDTHGRRFPEEDWLRLKGEECTNKILAILAAQPEPDEESVGLSGLNAAQEYADLRGVVFPQEVKLARKAVIADFGSAIFLNGCIFAGRILARFEDAVFGPAAVFSGTDVLGETRFVRALFCRGALFDGATFHRTSEFNQATFHNAMFAGAKFLGGAYFSDSTFHGANFNAAKFYWYVSFGSAKFASGGTFTDTEFLGEVFFKGAEVSFYFSFRGPTRIEGRADFSDCRFEHGCDFSNRIFEYGIDFSGTTCDGVPLFHGCKLSSASDFSGAHFSGKTPPRNRSWIDRSRYMRVLYALRKFPPLLSLRWPGMKMVRDECNRDAAEFETAFRALRRLTQESGDIQAEGMFHALELRWHAARTDARVLDRLGATLYGWLSDYGQSMARPLLWLAACWLAVIGFYAALLPSSRGVGKQVCDVPLQWDRGGEVVVAAGRQFLPSLFNSATGMLPRKWLSCFAEQHELALFFVNFGQTLFFIVCVTLFLIALRRRFQLRG